MLWMWEEMVLLQPCKRWPDLWGEEDNNPLSQRQILDVPATGFWPVSLNLNDQNREELEKRGVEYSRPGENGKTSALVEEEI